MRDAAQLFQGGIGNLAAYLTAPVLTCRLPAFVIAEPMAAPVPKAGITRWLGRHTRPPSLTGRRPLFTPNEHTENTTLTGEILGPGCANCRKLEAIARKAAAGARVDAEFVRVTDMKDIMDCDNPVHAEPRDRREAHRQRKQSHPGGGASVTGRVNAAAYARAARMSPSAGLRRGRGARR